MKLAQRGNHDIESQRIDVGGKRALGDTTREQALGIESAGEDIS